MNTSIDVFDSAIGSIVISDDIYSTEVGTLVERLRTLRREHTKDCHKNFISHEMEDIFSMLMGMLPTSARNRAEQAIKAVQEYTEGVREKPTRNRRNGPLGSNPKMAVINSFGEG